MKEYVIQVNVKKQDEQTEFWSAHESSAQQCFDFIKELIEKQNETPFTPGIITAVEIKGKVQKAGKSISMTFRGIHPKETSKVIARVLSVGVVK